MRIIIALLLAVLLALATFAWRRGQVAPPPVLQTVTQQVYQVKGILKEILPGGEVVKIQHEKIPGYMEAMTMPLDVKDTNEITGLKPGDILTFNMVVTPDDAWIEKIVKVGTQAGPVVETIRVGRDVEPLKEGDVLPNYRFTNELGQPVELAQFKGQALALAFFYTRCPYPDFCPRTSSHLAEAIRQLKAMPAMPTNWHVFSLSFDPGFDTIKVLQTYARQYQADPQRWSFLTGDIVDIDAITEQFGMTITRGENLTWDHNVRTVVVDRQGQVQKIIIGNQWKPEELVAEMAKAAKSRSVD